MCGPLLRSDYNGDALVTHKFVAREQHTILSTMCWEGYGARRGEVVDDRLDVIYTNATQRGRLMEMCEYWGKGARWARVTLNHEMWLAHPTEKGFRRQITLKAYIEADIRELLYIHRL